jgi:hypothetical protein
LFLQTRRVVPGVVPGAGTTLFAVLKIAASVEEARRFVVVSPKMIELPLASGGPFHILKLPETKGLTDPANPV